MPEGVGSRSGGIIAERVRSLDAILKHFVKRISKEGVVGLVRTTSHEGIIVYNVFFDPGFGYHVGIKTGPIKERLEKKFPDVPHTISDICKDELVSKIAEGTARVLYMASGYHSNSHKRQRKTVVTYNG